MSRVLAVNRCVLILGITLYIGFLNQTFLARNRRRIKKDGNFFFVLLRVLAKEKFFPLKFLIFYMFEENTASQQIFQGLPFLYLFS